MPSSLQRVEASTKEKQNKTKQIYITRVEIHLSGPASLVSVLLVPCSIFDYAFLAFFFCAKSSVNELIACLPHIEWMDGWFFSRSFYMAPILICSTSLNLLTMPTFARVNRVRDSYGFYMLCGKGRKHTRNKTHPRDYFRIFVLATKSSLLVLFQNCPL